MTRTEYSAVVILALTCVAWYTTAGARVPPRTADPPGAAVSGPSDISEAEKAVAARKERCRLHPGACKRSRQKTEPPKPSEP